jgi:putative Ca2+/H+ antiporter (TMEM165/GDT1 family)
LIVIAAHSFWFIGVVLGFTTARLVLTKLLHVVVFSIISKAINPQTSL